MHFRQRMNSRNSSRRMESNFNVLGVRRGGISEKFYIFVRYGGRKDMEIARRR
jgi:hypothetical protein